MKYQKQYDEKTREHILNAARKEFAQWGFEGARMANIAKTANVNKALIHYYFTNKETLYEIILRSIFIDDGALDVPIISGKWDLTPPQKLYIMTYFIAKVNFQLANPDNFRILAWEIAEGKTHLQSTLDEEIYKRQKLFTRIITDGIENGDFDQDYPSWTIISLFSLIIMYRNTSEFYEKMPGFVDIYKEHGIEELCGYIVRYVFKQVRPINKPLDIPSVPDDLFKFINDIFKYLKEKKIQSITGNVYSIVKNLLYPDDSEE